MGHKVNPNGFRLGITHSWTSTWFARGSKFKDLLIEDVRIKRFLNKQLKDAGISRIDIDRGKRTAVVIHTSKPGVIIGKQGAAIEEMRVRLEKEFGGHFELNIQEIRNPEADAEIVAETIQGQIARRMPYRRAAKMAMEKAMQSGAKGIKIKVSGRLNGAEIARRETFREGTIPLQTLRADVQHARRHAWTTYGIIGVQVWVYKGMVFKKMRDAHVASEKITAAMAAS